jgi:hypothetical protein
MFHCDTLCALKMIDRQVHDYLRRSVDQIIAGIEQLKTTPDDHWLDLELAPLETNSTGTRETVQPTRLQSVLDRVAKAARSILPSTGRTDSPSSTRGPRRGGA